ncbi:MAG TPA: hypothetical protein VMS40_18685, partial [Vicinamibacterales bacterium]|nr:hypothetical protein [Vicinamibacterales bacterium]
TVSGYPAPGARRSRLARGFAWSLLAGAIVLHDGAIVRTQNRGFLTGQNIAPVFEGWQKNADGTILMWYGYFNRNFEETIDVPIGPDNQFEPGPDQGQPTHFLPRRQRFVFKTTLPPDWPKERRLVWSMTTHGKTDKAAGWLQPEWEVDDGVIQMNMGPGGAPPDDPPNNWPTIAINPETAAVALGDAVKLTARASDDGIPKPRRSRGNEAPKGVTIRWIEYRGPGQVTFSAPTATGVYGTPTESTTTARFSAPGTYVLRAIASDGLLESPRSATVTVK